MTTYVLTHRHDEERGHDGVSVLAVSDDVRKLEDHATELETEKLLEELGEEPLDGLAPAAELAWADWGMPGTTWSVAVVPWGRYDIEEVASL